MRHGDVLFHATISFVAQSVSLSVWQEVQEFGILYLSVIAGVMKLKVCELTKEPGTPCVAIFGMWQATHWLPGLPSLWWVWSSRVAVCGPFGRRRAMTVEAELVRWFAKLRVILGAMHIMAGGAGHTVPVHDALNKVVALHPVLVRGSVREVSRRSVCPSV